jgi:ATPase subunit of ABC transporter with duplicated ATPase domains
MLRGHLGRFLFSGEKVFQKVGSLSGGEKTRLSIATLLVQNNNLLVLDEPTTYLDVLSQRLILEALKSYTGAMILVSHTPEFIEGLKINRKFYLPENKWELVM